MSYKQKIQDVECWSQAVLYINMMTSANKSIFRVTGPLCEGNSPVAGEFPSQRPMTRSFDVSFDLRPNKPLGQQPRLVIWNAIALILTSIYCFEREYDTRWCPIC